MSRPMKVRVLGEIFDSARPLTIFCSSQPLPFPNARVQVIESGLSLAQMGRGVCGGGVGGYFLGGWWGGAFVAGVRGDISWRCRGEQVCRSGSACTPASGREEALARGSLMAQLKL